MYNHHLCFKIIFHVQVNLGQLVFLPPLVQEKTFGITGTSFHGPDALLSPMQIITEMKEAQRIYPNRWPDHVLSSSATRPNLSKSELAPSNRFLTEVPSIKIQTMEAHTHTNTTPV